MAQVRTLLLAMLSGGMLYSTAAQALSLGEISLQSALYQPLVARIELDELNGLDTSDFRVSLAGADAFERAGIVREDFLRELRFVPSVRGGSGHIDVRSSRPVREPYLNFIVELATPNWVLLREYTVLLDPPGSAQAPLASLPQAMAVAQAELAQRAAVPVAPAAERGLRYVVQSGDSLWRIAQRYVQAGSTLSQQQLMDGIHALNPQAFSQGAGGLRIGTSLLLPDAAQVHSSGPALSEDPLPIPRPPSEPVPLSAPESRSQALEGLPVGRPEELLVKAPQQAEAEQAAPPQETPQASAELLNLRAQLDGLLANQAAEREQRRSDMQALQARLDEMQQLVIEKDRQVAELQQQLQAALSLAQQAQGGWLQSPQAPYALGMGGLLMLLLSSLTGWLLGRRRTSPVSAPIEVRPAPLPVVNRAQPSVAETRLTAPTPPLKTGPAKQQDVLEAVNIYLTYGNLTQALNTLQQALQQEPQRQDLQLRLLDVYGLQGNAEAFQARYEQLLASGVSAEQLQKIRDAYPQLQAQDSEVLFDELVLDIREPEAASEAQQTPPPQEGEFTLNLDELSLDADWDLVSPFAPPAEVAERKKAAAPVFRSNLHELPEVEEVHHDEHPLFAGRLASNDDPVLELDDLPELAENRDTLGKLRLAMSLIERDEIAMACSVLNEVIIEGDSQQQEEARELLARIA